MTGNNVTGHNLASALLAEIPAAEELVSPYRRRLDSNASLGIPAHVTVLFPFLAGDALDMTAHAELTRLFASFPRFACTLDHTDWFGENVLWLGPRDPGPFRALTELVFAAFPQCPPFAGEYAEVVPHLTVGHSRPVGELRAAEAAVRPGLPVSSSVTTVTLMTGPLDDSAPWTREAVFPLG
ncbi:MAG TPA: 2'-5' RNA ligase family protein [Trebonia sp.]|jgi:2'-5' RNA ligase|nr:2'-5' RNA ligase family protein [Trebonia sp.]